MSTIDLTDAVEAAARAQYGRAVGAHPTALPWEASPEHERAAYRIAVRPHVEAAAPLIAAGALHQAADAFARTRPAASARGVLDSPAAQLRAMAHRHTAPQHHRPAAPAVPTAARPTTGTRHRLLDALRPASTTRNA